MPDKRFVISVLVADRVGVLRDIATALTDLDANIDGISQTVVAGYFTVIMTATFTGDRNPEAIRRAIMGTFRPDEASVVVRPHDPASATPTVRGGQKYIMTIAGPDHHGLLRKITELLAGKGINVEDWFVQFSGAHTTHIAEVTIPARLDLKQVQDELHQLLKPFGFTIGLQHENIFRATNEIGPITHLLKERAHAQDR